MFIPRVVFAFCIVVFGAGVVYSQDNPNKVIRFITTPGAGNDFKARVIAQGISGPLGQPVIVENRPTPVIVAETVAKAPPDGHTMLISGTALWITPLLQKTPYDAERDLSAISLVEKSPTVLAVHPSLPVKSVKELIALAKARPGELNYASSGTGSTGWLMTELFKSMAGVNIVSVPYKTGAQAFPALISGEVQVLFVQPELVLQNVKMEKLRALAVTSAEPSALAPGLPTIAASGLSGYDAVGMTGIFTTAKTPGAMIIRLNREIVRMLTLPEVKQKFLATGIDIHTTTPEELAALVKSDIVKWTKVMKDAGLKTDS